MNYQELFEIGRNGWFDFKEIYDEAILRYPKGVFLEIGSWQGMSAAYMLEKSKEEQNYITFYCLDTFKGDPLNINEVRLVKELGRPLYDVFTENMNSLGFNENIDYHVINDQSELAHSSFPDAFFDFIFIDGGHEYNQVCRDIDGWLPKVKSGGMLAGHDYNSPGVERAVKERFKNFNVKKYSWVVEVGENNEK